MDPITALATIVQLLGLFRQEQGQRTDLTHQQFMEWLEYHRHQELKDIISHTFHLSQEVDQLLRADQAEILATLNNVNSIVVDILRHVEGLSAIAETLAPDGGLSTQAVEILALFVSSGAKTMVPTPDGLGCQFAETQQAFHVSDVRFLQDDLDSLVSHGFVSISNAGPFTLYGLTRRGAKFISTTKQSDATKA